jgi:hypothetical protein
LILNNYLNNQKTGNMKICLIRQAVKASFPALPTALSTDIVGKQSSDYPQERCPTSNLKPIMLALALNIDKNGKSV